MHVAAMHSNALQMPAKTPLQNVTYASCSRAPLPPFPPPPTHLRHSHAALVGGLGSCQAPVPRLMQLVEVWHLACMRGQRPAPLCSQAALQVCHVVTVSTAGAAGGGAGLAPAAAAAAGRRHVGRLHEALCVSGGSCSLPADNNVYTQGHGKAGVKQHCKGSWRNLVSSCRMVLLDMGGPRPLVTVPDQHAFLLGGHTGCSMSQRW